MFRRSIQHQHLGQLALPAAEFLAVTHGTSYAGYSAERNTAVERPFFFTGKPCKTFAVARHMHSSVQCAHIADDGQPVAHHEPHSVSVSSIQATDADELMR